MAAVRKIAVVNRKGGVGKTAMTVNIGHALALTGQRVALVDLDPQGHLSTSLGCEKMEVGIDQVLLKNQSLDAIVSNVRDDLNLYPAGTQLSNIEQLQQGGASRGTLLRDACNDEFSQYDFVLYDCPPSVGILMTNGLLAADEVVSPVTGDYLALEGLSCIVMALRHIQQSSDKVVKHWVAMSRVNVRRRMTHDVVEKVHQHFPEGMLPTMVRESSVMAECPAYGQTVFDYKASSQSAQEFAALANDLVNKRVV